MHRPHWTLPRGSPDDLEHDPFIRIWLGSLVLIVAMYGYVFYEGEFLTLSRVNLVTSPLYVVLFFLTVLGLYWWRTHETFDNEELIFYFVVAIPAVYIGTAYGFWYLTELGDIEIRNGYATSYEWNEGYYTSSYDSKSKTTKRTYHSARYYVYTSNNGEYENVSSTEWSNAVARWGGSSRVSSRRMALADGEGFGANGNGIPEVHTISWDNKPETRVATAIEHRYVNYIKASDSVLKVHGAMGGYESLLSDYPRTSNNGLGPICVDRVISKGVTLPSGFAQQVDKLLDDELCTLGASKECNIMCYFVGTERMGFFEALREKWQLGKKNDIVVVVGCSKTKIQWCRVMSLTDRKLFLEKLEQRVRDIGDINGKESHFVSEIVDQVKARGDAGYLRKPMSDFDYLAASVNLPWWAEVLVVLGSCITVMPTIILIVRD